jgi:hypothetical protein
MIRAVLCDTDEARGLLASLKSRKTDQDNRFTVDEMLAHGPAFKIQGPDGEALGAYVTAPKWPLLWLSAFAGRADFDLTAALDALLAVQGRGFKQLGFRTERPGLMRKALRLGYQVTRREGRAYYLRKNIA